MNIDELIKEKVSAEMGLQAYMMTNAYGRSIEESIELEKSIIEYKRKLYQIDLKIKAYISRPAE